MVRVLTLVPVLALAAAGTVAVPANAAEVEPPGTVLISTDLSDHPNISLSPGRIVWNGAANGGQVLKRALSYDGETVSVGSQTTIGPSGGFYWGSTHHSSSGGRTLYSHKYTGGAPRVNLADGSKTSTLASSGAPLRMSGNRALYLASGKHVMVHDLHTGRTLDITDRYGTRQSAGNGIADLFGNNLVFLGPDLHLYLKNLSNSTAPVNLARPFVPQGLNVFTYGDWVAWDSYLDDGVEVSDSCGIRNIRTMAPATSFGCDATVRDQTLLDLTSAGAIVRSDIDASHATWKLRRYNGTEVTLPLPTTARDVAINGDLMAWVDADGLHAAPLPNPPTNRPRSFGDPVTKAKDYIGGSTWPFRLVTTAPLTACHVHITKSGVLVRQLDCSAGVLAAGEIQARWDSRNSHGNLVGPGTYRWTAYAANSDGSMLRSDGAVKPTTGTLTVVR